MKRAFLLLGLCAVAATTASAQGDAQARLRERFAAAGLAVGSPFPEIDIYDAAGKPVNTSRLKGFTTVVVSGCLT